MTLEEEIREWYMAEDERTMLDTEWEFRLRANRTVVQQACRGLKPRHSKRNSKRDNVAVDKKSNVRKRNEAHYKTPTARIVSASQHKRHRW